MGGRGAAVVWAPPVAPPRPFTRGCALAHPSHSTPPQPPAALCALSTCHPEQNPALAGQGVYESREVQDKQIARLVAKMPAVAALAYHRASGRRAARPNQRLGYAENFLYMLDAGASSSYRPHPRLARALDILFTLHAEHEMNCSTAAARHLASSGVDVYTAVAGAVGALYGPLHGGANEVREAGGRGSGVGAGGGCGCRRGGPAVPASCWRPVPTSTRLPTRTPAGRAADAGPHRQRRRHPRFPGRRQGQAGKAVWLWAPRLQKL